MPRTPTTSFVEGRWSFRPFNYHAAAGFHVYPKGERSHWSVKATMYPASDGKTWVISMNGFSYDARPSYDEAKQLVLSRLETSNG